MIFNKSKFKSKNYAKGVGLRLVRGQVMLLTVLILSGMILSATTIAGLLMLYQIRQSTDSANSTKAIYAADSGIEWRVHKFIKVDEANLATCDSADLSFEDTLGNGAVFQVVCDSVTEPTGESRTVDNDDGTTSKFITVKDTVTIRSTGIASKNYRALEVRLSRTYEIPAP